MSAGVLFQPGRIGSVEIANRLVRAGTSETAAGEAGEITEKLVEIYEDLARNRVGLILSGHMYCHTRGQYATRQVGRFARGSRHLLRRGAQSSSQSGANENGRNRKSRPAGRGTRRYADRRGGSPMRNPCRRRRRRDRGVVQCDAPAQRLGEGV